MTSTFRTLAQKNIKENKQLKITKNITANIKAELARRLMHATKNTTEVRIPAIKKFSRKIKS